MEISTAFINESDDKNNWSRKFWLECYEKTRCITSKPTRGNVKIPKTALKELGTYRDKLDKLNNDVAKHFWATLMGTDKDPKHEVVFGLVLYALDIATTSILLGLDRVSQSRMTLRTIAECIINLKYLIKVDDQKLWVQFQEHGMGQAKLVVQRLEEAGRSPTYLNQRMLGQIANDNIWVEMLKVDVGSWDEGDLRKRAINADLKELYDDYFTWPSSYSHGQWGAIRENVLELCGNPLHRFHRIPLLYPLTLNSSNEMCLI